MVLTASLLQTSLFKHWHAKSWTFCIFIMSHLFSSCPQSFACNVKYSTVTVWDVSFLDLSGVNTYIQNDLYLCIATSWEVVAFQTQLDLTKASWLHQESRLLNILTCHTWLATCDLHNHDLKFHSKFTQTESKSGVLSVQWVTCYRLKAAFVHELNGWTEKVCQRAQFLIHCATVTQLLFLAN